MRKIKEFILYKLLGKPNPRLVLLPFLMDWLDWATKVANGEDDDRYLGHAGLCYSSRNFFGNTAILRSEFEYQRMDSNYPFGEVNFYNRVKSRTQHLDPARLKWVKKTINTLEGLKA